LSRLRKLGRELAFFPSSRLFPSFSLVVDRTMTLRIVLIRDCQSVILLRDSRKVGAEGWQLGGSRKKNDRVKRKRERSWQAARETQVLAKVRWGVSADDVEK